MRWIEAVIETKSEEIEKLCDDLTDLGVDSMVIEDEADFRDFLEKNRQYWDYVDSELERKFEGMSRIKFYLSDDEAGNVTVDRIREAMKISPGISYIEDSDWENNWREFYKPMEIGERLLVVPEWEEIDRPDKVILRLDPGLIFGTGSHATTQMCLAEVEQYAEKGRSTLDLGCGSGILGIAACLCGCDLSVGCDIDPKAPEVARRNAALSGLQSDRFTVFSGDILADAGMRKSLGVGYDIVLANIVADVIISLAGIVKGFMAPDAVFICSGIIEGRQEETARALENAGFEIIGHRCREEWHCFTAK